MPDKKNHVHRQTVMTEIQTEIDFNICRLQKLLDRYEPLVSLCKVQEPDFYYQVAAGSMLQSYYNGIERIFRIINDCTDKKALSPASNHKALLAYMTERTENRPAVISAELARELDEYRAFRHVFRHRYDFELDWSLTKPLFLNADTVWKKFRKELEAFAAGLRTRLP